MNEYGALWIAIDREEANCIHYTAPNIKTPAGII
jgi:hypothetical protein